MKKRLNDLLKFIIIGTTAVVIAFGIYKLSVFINRTVGDFSYKVNTYTSTTNNAEVSSSLKEYNGTLEGKLYLFERYYRQAPNETFIECYLHNDKDGKIYFLSRNLKDIKIKNNNQENVSIEANSNSLTITLPNNTNLSNYLANFDEWQTSRKNIHDMYWNKNDEIPNKTNIEGSLLGNLKIVKIKNNNYQSNHGTVYNPLIKLETLKLQGSFKNKDGKVFNVDNLLDDFKIKHEDVKSPKLYVYTTQKSDMIFDIVLPYNTQLSDWIENINELRID